MTATAQTVFFWGTTKFQKIICSFMEYDTPLSSIVVYNLIEGVILYERVHIRRFFENARR